jgi:hypothetical protein
MDGWMEKGPLVVGTHLSDVVQYCTHYYTVHKCVKVTFFVRGREEVGKKLHSLHLNQDPQP